MYHFRAYFFHIMHVCNVLIFLSFAKDIHKGDAEEGRYTFSKLPDYHVVGGYIALVERQYFLNEKRIEHCCEMFSNILDNCLNDEVLNDEDEDVLDIDESEILENLDDFTLEEIDELSL